MWCVYENEKGFNSHTVPPQRAPLAVTATILRHAVVLSEVMLRFWGVGGLQERCCGASIIHTLLTVPLTAPSSRASAVYCRDTEWLLLPRQCQKKKTHGNGIYFRTSSWSSWTFFVFFNVFLHVVCTQNCLLCSKFCKFDVMWQTSILFLYIFFHYRKCIWSTVAETLVCDLGWVPRAERHFVLCEWLDVWLRHLRWWGGLR